MRNYNKMSFSSFFIFLIYMLFAPRLNKPLYANFLFRPGKRSLEPGQVPVLEGIQGKEVEIKGKNGETLNGWFFTNPDPESRFTILFNHGNAGTIENRTAITTLLLKAGYSVLLYDYQGYGYSSGSPTIDGVIDDACGAYDFLVEKMGIKPEEIIFYGESLGVSVSCHLANIRRPAALILQSGFSSLKDIAGHHYPLLRIYPRWLYPLPRLDSLSALKGTRLPTMIVHGQLDTVIPFSHAERLFNSITHDKKQFVAYADCAHSDICTLKPQEYVEALKGLISLV